MAKVIKVSRSGFTRCPDCTQHIQLSPEVKKTACPFCGASLLLSNTARPLSRLLANSRSSLLAASLFGVAALAGCGEEEEPKPTGDTQSSADTQGDVLIEDTSTNNPVALYGISPIEDTIETDVIEDTVPVAEYGIPPIP